MIRLMLMSALLAATAAQACPPKTYEFESVRLTHDGKLIKKVRDFNATEYTYETLTLSTGDKLELNATGTMMDTSFRLEVKFLSHTVPQGDGGAESSVYYVTETVTQSEGVHSTTWKSAKVTVSHTRGTRSIGPSGCGEVTIEEIQGGGSVSSKPGEPVSGHMKF